MNNFNCCGSQASYFLWFKFSVTLKFFMAELSARDFSWLVKNAPFYLGIIWWNVIIGWIRLLKVAVKEYLSFCPLSLWTQFGSIPSVVLLLQECPSHFSCAELCPYFYVVVHPHSSRIRGSRTKMLFQSNLKGFPERCIRRAEEPQHWIYLYSSPPGYAPEEFMTFSMKLHLQ